MKSPFGAQSPKMLAVGSGWLLSWAKRLEIRQLVPDGLRPFRRFGATRRKAWAAEPTLHETTIHAVTGMWSRCSSEVVAVFLHTMSGSLTQP